MTDNPLDAGAGLLLPPDVVQPFFLRFHRDDLHVMAFFVGHPAYEAVEAMIQVLPAGGFAIRAILTRHDQSQVDHINDEALLAEMRGAQREVCRREIDLALEPRGAGRGARLEFISHAGERVVLEVVTERAPDPRGGGLTDPGGHSATSSLPLMWRGASTLAGPRTQVTIDGVRYDTPVRLRSGAYVGHEGYYTEGHAMGVIRAGTVNMRLVRRPDRLEVGRAWVFDVGGDEVIYRLAECAPTGRLRIEKQGAAGETILAQARGERLAIGEIRLRSGPGSDAALVLAFDDRGGFNLAMQGAANPVTGRVEIEPAADGAVITLCPLQPDWACDRVVQVVCSRVAERISLATTVGGAAPRDR